MRLLLAELLLAFSVGCGAGTRGSTVDSAPARSRPQSLAGTWESANLAYDLMGTTLVFADDGTFATVIGVILSGTYKTTGNILTITLSGPGEARVESGVMHWIGGAVEITSGTRSRRLVPLTRISPNSLVGQ